MLRFIKQARRSIRGTPLYKTLCRKRKGSGGLLILTLVILLFLCLVLRMAFDQKKATITYDAVDDAIVSALTSATSNLNLYELGYVGHTVIYRDVYSEPEPSEPPLPGATPAPSPTPEEIAEANEEAAQDFLFSTTLTTPVGDSYLSDCYNDFVFALKNNLGLSDTFESSMPTIVSPVVIEEFSVYNRFEFYVEDTNGNDTLLHYRMVKYTTTDGGVTWNATGYNLDTSVQVYNSFDGTTSTIDTTCVTAKLSFDRKISDYNAEYMPGINPADLIKHEIYQRIVDVKKN